MTNNDKIPWEFLQAVPKTDLHVHLDGSVRIPTLIRFAKEQNVFLPSYTESGLRQLVFQEHYASLVDYLKGFGYTVALLQNPENLEQAAYELALDNQAEGVRYIEVRFAPQLHVSDAMDAVAVLKAVNKGLQRAQSEFNQKPSIQQQQEPPFSYGIICCAMRMFNEHFSAYYRDLMKSHRHTPAKEIYPLASLELARAAVIARDEHGLPVVGFDLAGEEAGYPAGDHVEAFRYAHKHFLRKTVHAGEAYGPESIFQAITDLYAERIGHGSYLLEPNAISNNSIQDKERYIQKLGEYIADRRVTLEICLTSNMQTNPQMRLPEKHTFKHLRAHRLSTTICTDNRTISNTTVTKELDLAIRAVGLSRAEIKSIIIYGFKRSFFPGSYLSKRHYVRQIIDYYEIIEKKFWGDVGSRRMDPA